MRRHRWFEWAIRQPEFPAYFAYLLGHEFGHATTVLTLWLAAYEALIFDVPALSGRDDWRWDEMPHEIRYDQFGLAVAEEVYGLEQLQNEIDRLLKDGSERDDRRLRGLLALTPRLDLSGLDADIAEFALPYRERLLTKWRKDANRGAPGMGRHLADLDYLWSKRR